MGNHANTRPIWPIFAGVALAALVVGLFVWGGPKTDAEPEPEIPKLADVSKVPQQVSVQFEDPVLPPLPGSGPLLVRLTSIPDGDPLPPAPGVDLRGKVLDDLGLGLADVRLEVLGGPHAGRVTSSGPGGNYQMSGLMPGTHRLRLTSGGQSVGRLQRVLSRGTTHRDFRIGAPVRAGLRLLDHLGKPLHGAKVTVDFGPISAVTDKEGVAWLDGVPRSLRVVVDVVAPDHAWVREELNFLPPPPAAPVALAAIPQAGRIRGRVESWPGGPLPQVTVLPRADRPGNRSFAWERWQGVEVESDGSFELQGLPADVLVDVRVFHPMGVAAPAIRSVQPGIGTPATVSFVVVARSHTLVGKVVDSNGKGLASAQVSLEARNPAAVLAALFPGLRQGTVAAQLPVPGPLRRQMHTGPMGEFQFTWADHAEGTGDFVLKATRLGYRSTQTRIRTARSSLRLVLIAEDHASSLTLEDPYGPPLPEVRWWVDGRLSQGQASTLPGMVTGIWQVEIHRGVALLTTRERLEIAGATTLRVR